MKKYLALLAFAPAIVLATTAKDSEYTIAIPSIKTSVCVGSVGLSDPTLNCSYSPIGAFTDRLDFSVDGSTTNSFEVVGMSLHYVSNSGRAHISYSYQTTLTNVYVVNLASGNIVAQMTNAPFWAFPSCATTTDQAMRCSTNKTDDWFVSVQLPAGLYALVINGTVSGNRPGIYAYTAQ